MGIEPTKAVSKPTAPTTLPTSGVHRNFLRGGREAVAHSGFGKKRDTTMGQGAKPPATNEILRFSHKKKLILVHFFIEKGHVVSAVTIDNAKIFSQLMSIKAEAW